MSSSNPNLTGNVAGRASTVPGTILTLIGMAMIGYVFYEARKMFGQPVPTVPVLTGANPNAATNAALSLGASVTGFAQRLLALLVACIAGSTIASFGVRMLFAAWDAAHPHPHPPASPPNP